MNDWVPMHGQKHLFASQEVLPILAGCHHDELVDLAIQRVSI
jgi:hypothetical protein